MTPATGRGTLSGMLEVSALHDEEEFEDLVGVLAHALRFPRERLHVWMKGVGSDRILVARDGMRLIGGLGFLDLEQMLGGSPVRTAGVTAVGIEPECRGKGVGSRLMDGLHDELTGRGFAAAILYPASVTFYRRSGYERAGRRITQEADVRDLVAAPGSGSGSFHRVTGPPWGSIPEIHARTVARQNGGLRRNALLWQRALQPTAVESRVYLLRRDGVDTGYLSYQTGVQEDPLLINDYAALDRATLQSLVAFLHDHATMARSVTWVGGPSDPLRLSLPEMSCRTTRELDWMLCVLDTKQLLEARGYPPGLSARFSFEVHGEPCSPAVM